MKLGIKVGPQKESILDLELTRAPYCEVWFNINNAAGYDVLFSAIKKQHAEAGLHFWGCLPDGTAPNLAYPDNELITASMALMKKTIDIAAQNHFVYVNIHPGTRIKAAIDFVHERFTVLSQPVEQSVSEQLFLEHASILDAYGQQNGVVFTIETVPQRIARDGWSDRSGRKFTANIYELPVSTLITASHKGLSIANDLCHTAANKISNNRDEIANFVLDVTKRLAPQTRLVHVGFLVPPYNGTDFHDHLDNPLLETDDAIPNNNELKQLLKLFENRQDVWAIVEPASDHPKNYFLLQKLTQ